MCLDDLAAAGSGGGKSRAGYVADPQTHRQGTDSPAADTSAGRSERMAPPLCSRARYRCVPVIAVQSVLPPSAGREGTRPARRSDAVPGQLTGCALGRGVRRVTEWLPRPRHRRASRAPPRFPSSRDRTTERRGVTTPVSLRDASPRGRLRPGALAEPSPGQAIKSRVAKPPVPTVDVRCPTGRLMPRNLDWILSRFVAPPT